MRRAGRRCEGYYLDVAVRSGGHDLLGASVCDGMVIDLSRMKAIRLNREAPTVHVEAGVRADELNSVTQAAGLAVPLGCHPAVSVAGLTLGDGLSWLIGTHGATCDHLLGADVVMADGKVLHDSASESQYRGRIVQNDIQRHRQFGRSVAHEVAIKPQESIQGAAPTHHRHKPAHA